MKTTRLIWSFPGLIACVLSVMGTNAGGQPVSGISNSILPVVTIEATQPIASRPNTNSGVFTVYRSGNPTNLLNVYYRLGGTASNGVDYKAIGPWVTIPAGAYSSTIIVTPINSGQTDALQTVVAELTPSPLMTPVNYQIGSPSNATVYIEGNGVTNIPPEVSLVQPPNGSVFYTPVNISLVAYARDVDGSVVSVEFFANTTSLGIVSNGVIIDPLPGNIPPPGTRAYLLTWNNATTGSFALTAKATDNGGATTVSDPVDILINPGPPPTNLPPVVRITSPPNGAIFRAPVNIPIFAYAFDPDGYVASVQFFEDGNSLGFGQIVPVPLPVANASPTPLPILVSNLFFLEWSNALVGTHALTAVATDNSGISATSAPPVNIIVLPSPPPPSNRPPIVDIVATDPIAIEGTNCWPWLGLASATPTWSDWVSPTPICRFFTNCGPKNAVFTVRRFGDTNADLTVTYAIGGTASNGMDYATLPGFVTIQAGQRAALVTVVPIDDGPPDITSTVILRLTPSTNTPPDYLVGFPPCAAALILDSRCPFPITGVLPDKCFHVNAPGPNGAWFQIECTTDLVNWTSLCTNQVVNGCIDFVDPDAPSNSARFYRAVPETVTPVF